MGNCSDAVKLAALISKFFKGELTEKEKLQLDNWLQEDPAHVVLFDKLKQKRDIVCKMKGYDRYDLAKSWKVIRKEVSGRKIRFLKAAAVAAIFLIFLGGIYFLKRSEVAEKNMPEVIVAGSHKARLILDNGMVVNLDTLAALGVQGARIAKSGTGLEYVKDTTRQMMPESPVYHQVCVPRGGEYDLLLEDGTRVWLNADSKFKFPVAFGRHERMVYLEGEAYFAVAKDSSRPFRVMAKGQMVEVLGTDFNVNAYGEEKQVYTTLVEGKVKVCVPHREELILLPGEQSVFGWQSGQFSKKKVHVEEFIDWKNGVFVFEDQKLEQILWKLARWYDFQIFYQSESLKEVVFQGSVTRYEDFGKVLELLERTREMKFRVQGKAVTVYK